MYRHANIQYKSIVKSWVSVANAHKYSNVKVT